ncbi:hypothetical protein HDU93_009661 [Gonapodya sp. JEL0774]|nr:hypothetical protein HDU93_009661 [Gonapodya sp. JEL0774]
MSPQSGSTVPGLSQSLPSTGGDLSPYLPAVPVPFSSQNFFERHPQIVDFISGTAGGCAGVLIGHPLDTLKVRMQTGWMASYMERGPGRPLQHSAAHLPPMERRAPQSFASVRSLLDSPQRATLVSRPSPAGSVALSAPSFSMLAVASAITKEEGYMSLYKGLLSPLVGVAVVNACLFGV